MANKKPVKNFKKKTRLVTRLTCPRTEIRFVDPHCPRCNSRKVEMETVEVTPVREMTEDEILICVACGIQIKDGKHYLKIAMFCEHCLTHTTFTDPPGAKWGNAAEETDPGQPVPSDSAEGRILPFRRR